MMVILLVFALNKMLEYHVDKNVVDIITLYTIQFILINMSPLSDYSVILEPVYLIIYIALKGDAFKS